MPRLTQYEMSVATHKIMQQPQGLPESSWELASGLGARN